MKTYQYINWEEDLVDFDTSEILLRAGEKLTPRLAKKFSKSGLKRIKVNPYSLIGKYIADTIYTPDKKDIILKCGEEIKESMLNILLKNNFSEISLLKIDNKLRTIHKKHFDERQNSIKRNSTL
jgi:DNA-directed RNA polymerase subunit beta